MSSIAKFSHGLKLVVFVWLLAYGWLIGTCVCHLVEVAGVFYPRRLVASVDVVGKQHETTSTKPTKN